MIKLDISEYNLVALNDFMRLFIIQLISQVLFSLNHNTELFSSVFIETTLYILVGVVAYWLLFNNFISLPKSPLVKGAYKSNS